MEVAPCRWQLLLLTILGTYFVSPSAVLAAQINPSHVNPSHDSGSLDVATLDGAPLDVAPHIDPAGLPGKLVIAGQRMPDAAFDVFVELAAKQPLGLLVLRADDNLFESTASESLLQRWQPDSGTPLTIIDASSTAEDRIPRIVDLIEQSSSVWLAGGNALEIHPALAAVETRQALIQLFQNGGNIGISGAHPIGLTGHIINTEADSLGLLPQVSIDLTSEDLEIDSSTPPLAFDSPLQVRLVIRPDGGLLLQQRHLVSLGDEPTQVDLADTKNKAAQSFIMQGKHRVMDHVSLRRAGRDRVGDPFPPASPQPTRVDNGTLIIVGGGGMPDGIIQRFVELAGGEDACILVLPTAMPDPLPREDRMAKAFQRAGAKEVHVLNGRTKEIVESTEYLELFSRATGIWFGGGRQWRFVDAYLDTLALPMMHGVLDRGGVMMGSSAGASIQAEYMARGTPIGNQDIMADGYERGLGFLPGAAIDQHFRQRDRFADMSSLVDRYPQLLGIGIDESTALIVEKEIGTVIGQGEVHFYNRRIPKPQDGPDYVSVPSGGKYHLVDRVLVEPERKSEDDTPPTVSLLNPHWLIEIATQSQH